MILILKKIQKCMQWIVLLFFGSTILAVFAYRYIPVPLTPLMIIRCVQQVSNGEKIRLKHHWVKMEEISKYLPVAVMASEDQRFLEHRGFDFTEIRNALEERKSGKRQRGGSTITQQTAKKSSYSIRFNIEESGNLIYGFSKLIHKKPSDGESFRMGNISFAQYVKTDFDFAKNIMIDDRNSLVFHIATGVAIPYGNSKSLPFEKLYFSGGANSVRGWSVRSLGPGRYHGNSGSLDYVNHTGDIKLDLNVEYRTHLFWKLNGAAFIDAGNVWTLKSRYSDDTGQFAFNRFYKEIAVSYGLGVRFDLDFLILRFDGGMKAINPMESGADRFPVIKPDFSRDFAFHFAVGYPF